MIKKIKQFFFETFEELKKTVWPDRKSLAKSAVVVVVGMLLISLYISVVDFSLLNIVDFVSNVVGK